MLLLFPLVGGGAVLTGIGGPGAPAAAVEPCGPVPVPAPVPPAGDATDVAQPVPAPDLDIEGELPAIPAPPPCPTEDPVPTVPVVPTEDSPAISTADPLAAEPPAETAAPAPAPHDRGAEETVEPTPAAPDVSIGTVTPSATSAEPEAEEVAPSLSRTDVEVVTSPPESGVQISIEPVDGRGPVGSTVLFTTRLTSAEGDPLADEWVYLDAYLGEEPEPASMQALTDADGVALFEHTREVRGVDHIEVSSSTDSGAAFAETDFTWRGVPQVIMSAGDRSAVAGTPVEWTATVIDDEGLGPEGVEVRFLARMPGLPDVDVVRTTDADGVATYTHSRERAGTELLEVTATVRGESVSDEANFVWTAPSARVQIELEPLESSGRAGGSVDFVATVTSGEMALAQTPVFFEASFQDDPYPVTLRGETDQEGVVVFHLDREGYGSGVDTITVWTRALGQSPSVGTTFTWRGPLTVTMSAGDGSAPAGSQVAWTATVSSDEPIFDGAAATPAAWQEEVRVRFLARMPGQPDVDVTLTPDADGIATYTHSRPVAGTDFLEVTATIGEESASDEANFLWLEPPPEVRIEIEPIDSSAEVGTTAGFAATVTGDGVPLPGETVYFSAVRQGTEDYVSLDGQTGDDGVVRFRYSREETGIDDIVVTTYAYEQETSAETVFTWRGPLEVTLSAGTGRGEVGTPLVVTATVREADLAARVAQPEAGLDWVEGISVRFLAQMPGQPAVDVLLTTDADGVATYTHTRDVPGTEQLLVEATVGEERASATGSFVWEEPPPVLELAVRPREASGPIDEPVEFLATLTGDGEPVPDETVHFTARFQGQDESITQQAVTDENGQARFVHTRTETGIDLIGVGAVVEEQEVGAETTFTWTTPPPVITLTQSATSSGVGTPVELTATLTLGDEAVTDTGVRFLGRLSGQPDVDVTVPTDAEGVATYAHARAFAGTEGLLVGATVDGQTAFDTGSIVWEVVQPPVVQIEIQPVQGSGPTGRTAEFTATVTADGGPLAEQSVVFSAVMPGAVTVTLEGETDLAGVARFAHTRTVAGVDAVTVRTVAFDQAVRAATTFTWQPPSAPTPVLTLTQSGTSGQVGTALTWTALLTADGEPVPGATIRFLGELEAAGDVDVTRTTDANGAASHTHSRPISGTEILRVTAIASGLSATGSFEWTPSVTPTTPPVSPTPTPTPTTPPVTPTPTPTPTTPPVIPTPIPVTPTPTPTLTTTPTSTPTPTPSLTPTPTPTPTPTTDPSTDVVLGRESATPGGDLEVSGTGCEPGSAVVISLEGTTLATTTADADGAFSARGAVASMPLGKYVVDVQCGAAHGEATVDLVSTAESSVAAASAASAAAVLTFFVLLGSSVFRSTFGSLG